MSEQACLSRAMDAYAENDGPLGAALDDIDNQARPAAATSSGHVPGPRRRCARLQPAVQLALSPGTTSGSGTTP
ncbi:MAG: hypothetical protein R2755_22175 [Acidimicrobiales bacterium]